VRSFGECGKRVRSEKSRIAAERWLASLGIPLVTWDREQQEWAAQLIVVRTPATA
jgi:hypothetical protein